jgi:hypothetical protein
MKETLNIGDEVVAIESMFALNEERVEKGSRGVIVKRYNLDYPKSFKIDPTENKLVKIKFSPESTVMINISRLNVKFKKVYKKEVEIRELII